MLMLQDWSIVRNVANRTGTRHQQKIHRGPEPMEWVRTDFSHTFLSIINYNKWGCIEATFL